MQIFARCAKLLYFIFKKDCGIHFSPYIRVKCQSEKYNSKDLSENRLGNMHLERNTRSRDMKCQPALLANLILALQILSVL